MSAFLDGITLRALARSGVVAVCLALVVWTTAWAMAYAQTQAARSGVDLGAIIAAVTGPATLLLNYVFKNYLAAS